MTRLLAQLGNLTKTKTPPSFSFNNQLDEFIDLFIYPYTILIYKPNLYKYQTYKKIQVSNILFSYTIYLISAVYHKDTYLPGLSSVS